MMKRPELTRHTRRRVTYPVIWEPALGETLDAIDGAIRSAASYWKRRGPHVRFNGARFQFPKFDSAAVEAAVLAARPPGSNTRLIDCQWYPDEDVMTWEVVWEEGECQNALN